LQVRVLPGPPAFAGFASFGSASHLVAKAAAPKPGGRRRAGSSANFPSDFSNSHDDMRLPSRGTMRPSYSGNCPRKSEGAGNTGCTLHPRSRVQIAHRKTHTSIQVQSEQSGIPCAMALRLITCSPRRRIRLVTVASELTVHQDPVGPRKPPPA